MRVGRTLPPAAAPMSLADLLGGLAGMLSGRRHLERLEQELRGYFGVRHLFLVSSGKASFALILRALRSRLPRDEVVIPAYTCFSVPSAIAKAGLAMAPCDVDPATLDFDYEQLRRTVGPGTLCVVATHLFGIPSDVGRVRTICAGSGAYVVEDAAQAMGVSLGGRKLGTLGDVGFFSLGRGKNVTCGSGGIVVTNDDAIAAAVAAHYKALRPPRLVWDLCEWVEMALITLFLHPRLYWLPAGLPALGLGETRYEPHFPMEKLSGMKAGVLRTWQARLGRSNAARSRAARNLRRRLPGSAFQADVPYLRLPVLVDSQDERDRLATAARARGLGIGPMYPTPVDEIPVLTPGASSSRFPGARSVAARLVTVPTHPLVSDRDVEAISRLFESTSQVPSRPTCEPARP